MITSLMFREVDEKNVSAFPTPLSRQYCSIASDSLIVSEMTLWLCVGALNRWLAGKLIVVSLRCAQYSSNLLKNEVVDLIARLSDWVFKQITILERE